MTVVEEVSKTHVLHLLPTLVRTRRAQICGEKTPKKWWEEGVTNFKTTDYDDAMV